ncbi:MAG: amino acid ABC transporter permease [Candidatus Arsenophonus melophagi]|nr:amino acid ABC transporter permease [Candidatus Arsenophonus melophagi]
MVKNFFSGFFSQLLELETEYLNWIWQGLVVTIWISFYTIILSSLLGFLVAIVRDSHISLLRWLARIYISLFRNTPLLIQLFFWYFAVGGILPEAIMQWFNMTHKVTIMAIQLEWPSFEWLAGMIGLTLYSTPFIAEDLRSGMYGVKQEQTCAALALGLSFWQTMRYVVFPQAFKIALPTLLGQYMNIVKNSSLTMAIGVTELSYVSRQIESQSLQTFSAFGVTTILYISIIACMEAWGQWRQQCLLIKGY